MLQNLLWPDYVVFFATIILTYSVVVYGRSRKPAKTRTTMDILLDGRRLTLPLFIATLVSTWYGGIFGVTQIAYDHGIYNFITQGVFWYASYLIFAFFLVPKLKERPYLTLPEVAKHHFGKTAKNIAAIFNILNVIPTTYALSIGIFVDALFHTGIIGGTAIGVSIVVGYSFVGGFRSIVLSDLVQFAVMMIAVMCVLVFSFITYGGIGFLKESLPESHFTITGGHSITTLLMWGFIALSTLVDPNFYHRVFAAKNPTTAKKGIIISTIIWAIFDIATTAGGMYAAAVLSQADSNTAYLQYGIEILPLGLKGLFLAGILATILSTLDSYLFIASSTMSHDMQKTKTNFFTSYRINFLIFALLSIVLAVMFSQDSPLKSSGTIENIWKTFGSYSAGCLLLPMLAAYAGLAKKGFSSKYFVISTLTSALLISVWRLSESGIKENALAAIWPNLAPLAHLDDLYIGLLTSILVIGLSQVHYKLQQNSENS